MTLTRLLALCVSLFACLSPTQLFAGELGQPYFQSIDGTDSIANGIVTVVGEDRRGLIWFGTPEGLYSFDGQRLRAFRNQIADPRSISDDYIRGLMASSDGRLWVATQGQGVSIFDPDTEAFENHVPNPKQSGAIPSVAALVLAQAPNGDVWVGFGNAGLARWDKALRQYQRFDLGVDSSGAAVRTVRALLFDRAGNLWIGTGNGLLRLAVGESKAQWVASEPGVGGSFDRQYVYALFEASDGRIWVGTQSQGAAVIDPKTAQLIRFNQGDRAVSHPWISGFVEPEEGRIWIHTYGGGIDIVDASNDAIVQRIRGDLAVSGGLALDRLTAPFRDQKGMVWVGTWGAGLQRHNPNNARSFRTLRHSPLRDDGLSHPTVLSTLPIDATRLWVGTGGNGIDVVDLQRGVVSGYRPHATRPGALRDGTVRTMVAAGGKIWVGTQHGGLQSFDLQTEQFSEPLQAVPRAPIRQLLLTQSGTLAVGMQASLLIVDTQRGTVRRMQLNAEQAFTDAVWSLAEDASQNLWIGTPNALFYWPKGERFPTVAQSDGVVLRAIVDLHTDNEGVLWVTGPSTLARVKKWTASGPQFEDLSRQLKLQPQGLGQQLMPDLQRRLWTPRAVIDPNSLNIDPIGVADGVDIGSVEIGSGSISSSGSIFFGGTRGLLIIDPARFRADRRSANLILTSAAVDGRPISADRASRGLGLHAEQKRLTVEFAALDYAAPSEVRYAYRLNGLDRDWIEADYKQRIASYHNLWPGEYQLEIQAQLRSGVMSSNLIIPLVVEPAWWQTRSAAFLAVVLLSVLIYLGFGLRTLQIRRRAGVLEALVDSRTRELSAAKTAAEQALLDLKGAQKQLVEAEKMASLGQLVAGVAHEINTPVGVAITAATHLQDLSSEGNAKIAENRLTRADLVRWKDDVEEAARLISSSLTRAGALIASFKQVSVDQASGQRRRFQLRAFLGEVQTTMLASIKRSRHQLDIQCPNDIEVDSYPGPLFQVLTNLINNALVHAFADQQEGRILVVAAVQNGLLELTISDDGRGMDAETARRAFDPFFTTRRGSGGSGLGLHVVHNLLTQLLAGEITLKTAPNLGAAFIIRMPLQTPEQVEI